MDASLGLRVLLWVGGLHTWWAQGSAGDVSSMVLGIQSAQWAHMVLDGAEGPACNKVCTFTTEPSLACSPWGDSLRPHLQGTCPCSTDTEGFCLLALS